REAILKSSNARFPRQLRGMCASRYRHVAFVTVTCSPRKARGPEFSILACRDTKSRALLTNSGKALPDGGKGSVWAWAGTGDMMEPASHAGGEILAIAGI